ncbi:MAG: single-stranded DNA-binding protein [Promethearchaeota archaeon]
MMVFDEVRRLKIENLTPFVKHIEVSFKIINKGEVREIVSKRSGEMHNLCDITVADSTGAIILTLWDNDIDLVEEGKDYILSNGYVNVFRNSMRLSKGKYGVLSSSDEPIEEVNTFNNLSDRYVERPRSRRRYSRYRSSERNRYYNRRGW